MGSLIGRNNGVFLPTLVEKNRRIAGGFFFLTELFLFLSVFCFYYENIGNFDDPDKVRLDFIDGCCILMVSIFVPQQNGERHNQEG